MLFGRPGSGAGISVVVPGTSGGTVVVVSAGAGAGSGGVASSSEDPQAASRAAVRTRARIRPITGNDDTRVFGRRVLKVSFSPAWNMRRPPPRPALRSR